MRRIITTLSLALVALFAATTMAHAASTQQIINDLKDGVLQGKYTAGELRSADKAISPQQREYNGWDDIYAAYLIKLSTPKTPNAAPPKVTPVAPVDSNGNGAVDPAERAAAELATAKKQKAAIEKVAKEDTTGAPDTYDEPAKAEKLDADKRSAADEDSSIWPVIVILVILAALMGVTIWRVIINRRRNHGDPRATRDEFSPENAGRNDIERDARFDARSAGTTELPVVDPPSTDADHLNPDGGISDQGPDDPRA